MFKSANSPIDEYKIRNKIKYFDKAKVFSNISYKYIDESDNTAILE